MKKHIVLCADDYGQASCISQGIIELLQQHRLSATSCMVNSPGWKEQSTWLMPFKEKVDIGLHFNLTDGYALSSAWTNAYGKSFQALPTLLRKAFFRLLDPAIIEAECEAQIDCFAETLGMLPCFIDGHQHIHQFPVIRQALINTYQKRFDKHKPYIRLVNERLKLGTKGCLKKTIIYLTGTSGLKRLLDKYDIPYNQSFAGIYAFSCAIELKSLFPKFLHQVQDGGLIMCHPGLKSSDELDIDPIAHVRELEYQYLASAAFLEACKEHEISIGRFIAASKMQSS